ncbi:MAG: hypothetical protein HKN88_10170 [Gammaproteobacteria bacterium]|nr:hypothetical protein [Gammaproteobacteria bacterium]
MRIYIAILFVIFANTAFASDCISFGESEFCQVWESDKNDVKTSEYLPNGQSLEAWKNMITVRKYSNKTKLKEVLPNYVNSVKPMFALAPEILQNEDTSYPEDVYLLLTLLAPDKSRYEYVINRFYSDGNDVYSIFYSHKLPFAKEIDFTEVMENKYKWLELLRSIEI